MKSNSSSPASCISYAKSTLSTTICFSLYDHQVQRRISRSGPTLPTFHRFPPPPASPPLWLLTGVGGREVEKTRSAAADGRDGCGSREREAQRIGPATETLRRCRSSHFRHTVG
uniref:Uncharacterized protein n=1 Tax=Arundo donax TaxID=35708 RepID=A0A0A8YTY6_ARUDO